MMDYRLPENRREYFTQLYYATLKYKVSPGLVYLFMPELANRYGWSDDQKLWFAFINGMTQNPITSMRILEVSPFMPQSGEEFRQLDSWFNAEWEKLSFDTDRRKQKRDTLKAIWSYVELVKEHGSQASVWAKNVSYQTLWERANGQIYSFGRLSAFSYLEYVKIMGYGNDCSSLMFEEKDGSRSHRNGALFLLGHDNLVWDKRANNGFDGKYDNFEKMCTYLANSADDFLTEFNSKYSGVRGDYYTLESCLCTFKNSFFSRRYYGVYADMSWDRIKWYDDREMSKYTEIFKDIRSQNLPNWLREECEPVKIARTYKASQFAKTGLPYRGEYFL